MEQLKPTTATSVTIPKEVERFMVMEYRPDYEGWSTFSSKLYTTPEGAQEDFLRHIATYGTGGTHYLIVKIPLPVVVTEAKEV